MEELAYLYLLVYLLVMWVLWRVLLRHVVKFYYKIWKDVKFLTPISWITLGLQVLFFGYVYYVLGWNALKVLAWITIEPEDRGSTLFELWVWI